MTTLVTRLYASPDRARAAADALLARGYDKDDVKVLSALPGTGIDAAEDLLAAAGLVPRTVTGYAPALVTGQAVVAAMAPTGSFFKVRDVLEGFGPVATDVPRQDVHISDEAVFRAEAKPYTLMTGRRFCGNNFLLLTGTYWGGPQRKLLTGTRWSGNRIFKSDRRWSGNPWLLLTGTFWGGFWPRLLTGTYWGGPVPRIIEKR
jgi:hypothetical protein